MNIAVQNYPIKTNYNAAFKGKEIMAKAVPGVMTGAALTTAAAVLTRPLHEAAKQQLLYTPEGKFPEKSAVKSWCDFYYGYRPVKIKPYSPEDNFAEKSASDSVWAFIDGSKLTGTNITRDARGRITKIVREYEPAYTIVKTFEYKGSDSKSVVITTDYSYSSYKEVQKYENGSLVETYSLEKGSNKYRSREKYIYDTAGKVSKRLSYTVFGYLWEYEYKYDSKDRIVGITITQSNIPETEKDSYCRQGNDNNVYVTKYEYSYIKNSPKLIKRDGTTIKPNGETIRSYSPVDENDPEAGFFDPNPYTKLTKNKLNQ